MHVMGVGVEFGVNIRARESGAAQFRTAKTGIVDSEVDARVDKF
jgi:hypothetical protein